jgi:NADH:ubiquinone oxidoreductase subunit F (NADH-binding)
MTSPTPGGSDLVGAPGWERVLDREPVADLDAYVALGGGDALKAALHRGPGRVIDSVDASGLRGRGGAGFPTAEKWRSIAARPATLADGGRAPTTVVVNAAEGEPGTFKDRAILRANPYRVLEGALVAAHAVGADRIAVATKARFTAEVAVLRRAAAEMARAGWTEIAAIEVHEGPDQYLYGEETALLEVLDGRPPFPRIAPPWRRGIDAEPDAEGATETSVDIGRDGAIAETTGPVLVDNVETLAHVALVLGRGETWFRSLGHESCPGTIVCTLSGTTSAQGVLEVPTGTPLGLVVDALGDGHARDEVAFALSGVSNPLLRADAIDVPLTYDHLRAAGSGLGTAGFILFDRSVDPWSVALGASRFLAVESCGQCTPCKQDGLAIAAILASSQDLGDDDERRAQITSRLGTITDGARCYLATQHRDVVESFLVHFPEALTRPRPEDAAPYPVVEIVDMVQGPEGASFVLDEAHLDKQPDWSHEATDSGQAPADRFPEA